MSSVATKDDRGIQSSSSTTNKREKNSKSFRFVNNSPNSMVNPKLKMKPAFRVDSQEQPKNSLQQQQHKSVIIEQSFDHQQGSFNSIGNDKKYVFQLNVKRPPGRPRKYPTDENRVKRPQGRPRKLHVDSSTKSKLLDSNPDVSKINITQGAKSSTSDIPSTTTTSTKISDNVPDDIVIDSELISKRGRGRPRRANFKETHNPDNNTQDDDDDVQIAVKVATTASQAERTQR